MSEEPADGDLARASVLIVDDEEDVRESLRDVLEMVGCTALLAESGAEALIVERLAPGEHRQRADLPVVAVDGRGQPAPEPRRAAVAEQHGELPRPEPRARLELRRIERESARQRLCDCLVVR